MNSILFEQRALQQPLEQYQHLASQTLARILSARDVQAAQLDLQLKFLLQPHMLGLDIAVELIHQAIEQQQKILIVGDYDADGATSTALMVLVLREMGAQVDYIVPDRFKYGYGLTPAIAELAAETINPDLLITVDNGISSHAGVDRCHELGMKVIITDHHLTTKETPKAEAVVNPNQLSCTFPSKALAGVGVAFYVLANLATYRQKLGLPSVKLSQYLDLVALGTIADVAKLDFNNRILVKAGLERIQKSQCRLGILALLEIAGKLPQQIQSRDLGFVLGPRINAAGRMDSMRIGIECLLAQDFGQAYDLAKQLDQLNLDRRQVEQTMREQAFEYIEQAKQQEHVPEALIVFEPDWHQGVIGIVAGRLKEHFHRPSIVFAEDEDGEHLKGSARSIEGIHIRDAIEYVAQQSPHLVKYFGGHAAAAGLTIQKQYFEEFKQALINCVAQNNPELFTAKLYTDGALAPQEFTLDFMQAIDHLGPWGQGCEAPIFEGIFEVLDYQWLKDVHLKLSLHVGDGVKVEAIGFNLRDQFEDGICPEQIRLAYTLDKNEFRQQVKLQLKIVNIQTV